MRTATPAGLLARTPLRVRLVAALVVLVALALLVTGATVTTVLRNYLVGQVDQDLSRPLGELPRGDDPGSPFDPDRAEYYRLTAVDGRQVDQRTNGLAPPPPDLGAQDVASAGVDPFTADPVTGDSAWRVLVRPVQVNGEDALFVRAISLADVEATAARLMLLELLVGVLALLLMAGAGHVVVRRSLRPLGEVETTAAAIAAGDLSRRVPESDPRTEVGRLSRALNGMLVQIETAFRARQRSEASALASEDRMRRFVADASHELRTPLTSIRGFAELHRQGAVVAPDDVGRLLRKVEDEASRMGLLVEDLLLLARLDEQRPLQQVPVDLLAVVTDAAEGARVLAPDRTIDVVVRGDEAPVVLGDEPRLRQVVTNLVSNALTHTPSGSPVGITVDTLRAPDRPAEVCVAVHDRGPGLSPEDIARVFERFYRADRSRTRAAGGTGLGLSIVSALVAAHGGRVTVEPGPGRGSVFAVYLPLHALTSGPESRDAPAPCTTA